MKSCYILFFCLSISIFASTFQEHKVQRLNGSYIQVYLDVPASESFPLLIFIQGSGCKSFYNHKAIKGLNYKEKGYGLLFIEKYGLTKEIKGCPKEYLENNTVDQRLHDYLNVISWSRKKIKNWSKELYILGGSEGGIITPILAKYLPEVKKIGIFGSGGMSMSETVPLLIEKYYKTAGATDEAIKSALSVISKQIELIRLNPKVTDTWMGQSNTFLWWHSVLWKRPIIYLEQLEIPIYLLNGDRDESEPIESPRLVKSRFEQLRKNNLNYVEVEGLDHTLTDENGVSHLNDHLNQLLDWFTKSN